MVSLTDAPKSETFVYHVKNITAATQSISKIIPVSIVLKWSPENGKAIEVENEKIVTKSYMRSGPTILRLLEKTRTWSGEDDSTIKVCLFHL